MLELDVRKKETLLDAYQLTNQFISRAYLDMLPAITVKNEVYNEDTTLMNVRLIRINKISYDKNEDIIDKLTNVYNAVYDVQGGLVLILESKGTHVNFYLGVRSLDNTSATLLQKTLAKSIQGNFPGCNFESLDRNKIKEVLNNITNSNSPRTSRVVATVSGISTLKNENKESFVQGLEKFIDTMRGERYSAVFLADSISKENLKQIRSGYEEIYTQMSPFASTDLNFGANESINITEGISKGFTSTISSNLTQTQSYTQGTSQGHTVGTSESHTSNKGAAAGTLIGTSAGLLFGPAGSVVGSLAGGVAGSLIGSLIGSETESVNESNSYSTNESKTHSDSQSRGSSQAESVHHNDSKSDTTGQSRNLQIKLENKTTQQLLLKIDAMLERIQDGENFGMWDSVVYFLADDIQTARVASSNYAAIIRGQNTSVEGIHVNIWDQENKLNLARVTNSLKSLSHPKLVIDNQYDVHIPHVTPGTLITTPELTIQMSWPRKSVQGLAVLEYAEFSRDIITYDDLEESTKLKLGKVYHMGQEESTRIEIDVESLSMHTFVTGSTGSGKSNTIYHLLNELKEKNNVPFLVIEPAKGEYKNVFGGLKDVTTLGTNPIDGQVLKINPFSFPKSIHILEHIDRLTEIFNICWPMYAAMPAVLKQAIESAYMLCGWDLDESINPVNDLLFPTFTDLLEVLPDVIQETAYSDELKGNYIGALVTRVKSLTNGLNGKIFGAREIPNEVLFDTSCIIDLHRIGNTETKALIMGVLVMKLQEYRMSTTEGCNLPLKHITVLEEAHNILRRTSTEQSTESSNILGKAVELLSNSIAEMRTYGEGFIIVDQSPGLLDLSAIRNTNTKIILRLPDQGDRELVGRSAGLNDEQVNEIVKLKRGVAVVYQNNWIQPVLCSMQKFTEIVPFKPAEPPQHQTQPINKKLIIKHLLANRFNTVEKSEYTAEEWIELIKVSNLSGNVKKNFFEKLYSNVEDKPLSLATLFTDKEIDKFIVRILDGESILRKAVDTVDFDNWNEKVNKMIDYSNAEWDTSLKNEIVRSLLREFSTNSSEMKDFYLKWEDHQKTRFI